MLSRGLREAAHPLPPLKLSKLAPGASSGARAPTPGSHPPPGPRTALLSSQARPAAGPLTFVPLPSARHGQELRQRQEQDEQASFPRPHRGSESAASRTSGSGLKSERRGTERGPLRKSSPAIGWRREAAGQPIPGRLGAPGRVRPAARPRPEAPAPTPTLAPGFLREPRRSRV